MTEKANDSFVIVDILKLIYNIFCSLVLSIFRFLVPPLQKPVKGEIVLITGAANGIGRQLAFEFGRLGAHVICWDIDEGSNKALILSLNVMGYQAHAYKCDVADQAQVTELALLVKKTHGNPSIVVNNAGVMPVGGLLDIPTEQVVKTFNVNILAHFWTIKAFLPDMLMRKRGHIVAVCSMCGVAGVADMATYCATKFAIRGLMEAVSEEVRMMGLDDYIHFTTVFPFYVDTGMAPDPHYRFPSLFSAETPENAAQKIVKGVRMNNSEISIPSGILFATSMIRLFPKDVYQLVMDFLSGNRVRNASQKTEIQSH